MSKETKTNNKKKLTGTIIGNKMTGTVKVQVDTPQPHPVYKKMVSKRKVFFAHTDKELEVGQVIEIRECKPVAKNVKFKVETVLE